MKERLSHLRSHTSSLFGAGFFALVLILALNGDRYDVRLLAMAGIQALLALGFHLIFGRAALLYLGQGAFFALGAYSTALFTIHGFGNGWLALLFALLLAGLAASGLASILTRLNSHYLALASLSFAMLVHLIALHWQEVTGGANGLAGPSGLAFWGLLTPAGYGWLLFVWILVALGLFVASWFGKGDLRLIFALLREDRLLAASLGIEAPIYLHFILIAGSLFAALAGGLHWHNLGVISPAVSEFSVMVLTLVAVVIGGRLSPLGAVIGAFLIIHLPEWLRIVEGPLYLAGFGLALLLVIRFMPEGIAARLKRETSSQPPEEPACPPASDLIRTEAAPLLPPSIQAENRAPVVLTIRGVRRSYGPVCALDGVSFELHEGEIVGLIGPNGSGKTTLLNLISGLESADKGEILFFRQPLVPASAAQRARLGIARLFQKPRLVGSLTAEENVMLGALVRHTQSPLTALLGRSQSSDIEVLRLEARARLHTLGMARPEMSATELTIPEQRLTELARALAFSPKLLLLDEPAAGLSEPEQQQALALLRPLKKTGLTLLVTEHHLPFLTLLADRLICLEEGRILAEGACAEVLNHPAVRAAYLPKVPA